MANIKSIQLLDEGKIRIEGKIRPNANIWLKTTAETYFEIEVTVPPGQILPEHFYLSLLRGDIPGAYSDISGDTTYCIKLHHILNHGVDSNADIEQVDEKEGKISQLEQEWEELFCQPEGLTS